MLLQRVGAPSFSLLRRIPLCKCTIVFGSTRLLMGTSAASSTVLVMLIYVVATELLHRKVTFIIKNIWGIILWPGKYFIAYQTFTHYFQHLLMLVGDINYRDCQMVIFLSSSFFLHYVACYYKDKCCIVPIYLFTYIRMDECVPIVFNRV